MEDELHVRDITAEAFLWQLCWLRRREQEAIHNRMLEDNLQQQQNIQQPETFFRPWEHPPTNQPANIAVVRPFHLNHSVLSAPRVTSPRENLHKKLLRGNYVQYHHRYQQQQQQQFQQNNVNCTISNVNHDPESVILSRPLFLETISNEQKMIPKTTKPGHSLSSKTYLMPELHPECESSSDLIICEGNNKNEQSDVDSGDDVEDIDCESGSSESSNSTNFHPLDLRTTKIHYSSTAQYEISVIRSLSPVSNNKTPSHSSKDPARERKSRKLKTKRRICTACNRTYLKTKNLRWHFKSKLHMKRVNKLGIDDPANQPDTWYKTSEQHDIINKNFLVNNIQDELNIV